MPSEQSARAAREIDNCAHTLVTESSGSCWPAPWLFWQQEIGVFLCPLSKHVFFYWCILAADAWNLASIVYRKEKQSELSALILPKPA